VLRWITRHGVVTAEQVARTFFARPGSETGYSEWAAKHRLAALSHLGLIVRNANPYPTRKGGGQQLLRASRVGARLADVGVSEAPLVISELRHTLALVSLTEFLLERHPGATLTTERELRAQEYRRRYHGGSASRLPRIPDAVITIPRPGAKPGDHYDVVTIAIELDLSNKDRRAMQTMIERYRRMSFDKVWWYVKAARVEAVQDLVQALRVHDRFEVIPVRWPA
jgi:hypothetical protein